MFHKYNCIYGKNTALQFAILGCGTIEAEMKGRVLAVGDDQSLLSTRLDVLNTKWSARIASSKDALAFLKEESFDVLVLCHSIHSTEAISLVTSVQRDFPEVRILALEELPGSRAHLNPNATVVSAGGPTKMFDAIEKLLSDDGEG